jgi:hypothetical protein
MSCNMLSDSSSRSCSQVPVNHSSTTICNAPSITYTREMLQGAKKKTRQAPVAVSFMPHLNLLQHLLQITSLRWCRSSAGATCMLLGQHTRSTTDVLSAKHTVPFFARRAVKSTPVSQHAGDLRLYIPPKPLPCAILVYTSSHDQ